MLFLLLLFLIGRYGADFWSLTGSFCFKMDHGALEEQSYYVTCPLKVKKQSRFRDAWAILTNIIETFLNINATLKLVYYKKTSGNRFRLLKLGRHTG